MVCIFIFHCVTVRAENSSFVIVDAINEEKEEKKRRRKKYKEKGTILKGKEEKK